MDVADEIVEGTSHLLRQCCEVRRVLTMVVCDYIDYSIARCVGGGLDRAGPKDETDMEGVLVCVIGSNAQDGYIEGLRI